MKKEIMANVALATILTEQKVRKIADECGVRVTLVDTSLRADRKWVNDFEVEGASGKVDAMCGRVRELESE